MEMESVIVGVFDNIEEKATSMREMPLLDYCVGRSVKYFLY